MVAIKSSVNCHLNRLVSLNAQLSQLLYRDTPVLVTGLLVVSSRVVNGAQMRFSVNSAGSCASS